MNNAKPDYGKVTPALIERVKEVIADADRHAYSVSKVYAAHNAIFGLHETPQTCSSCLRNRVRDLRDRLKGYEEFAKINASKLENPSVDIKTHVGAVKSPNDSETGQKQSPQPDKPKKAARYPMGDAPVKGVEVKPNGRADIKGAGEDLT